LNGQISQDEINAILWRACDTFRGTVDPAEYKNYILVMLFVKYISDAWRDHYDAYRAQLGDAYEFLIGKFAAGAGKKAGEFYTPPEVSTLLAKLVAPRPRERIADPACGSGSLLIKCGHEVGNADYALYGQENNGATWALAKMNMFLHDVSNARIDWGDTLKEPTLLEGDALMRFNVVVANFPFSLDKWGAEDAAKDRYRRFWRGIPPKSAGDYAFITHMIETTYTDPAQNGRVGVIAPRMPMAPAPTTPMPTMWVIVSPFVAELDYDRKFGVPTLSLFARWMLIGGKPLLCVGIEEAYYGAGARINAHDPIAFGEVTSPASQTDVVKDGAAAQRFGDDVVNRESNAHNVFLTFQHQALHPFGVL